MSCLSETHNTSKDKFEHKKFFFALWPSPPLYRALCICIMAQPNLSIGRNTYSAMKNNILPA